MTKIIVGLGNFGDKYAYTYHNIGFLCIEAFADKFNAKFKTRECASETAAFFFNGQKIVLAKPLTYMNLSGDAVKQLLAKYNTDASNLIVVYDDVDLPKYSLRVRPNGSAGTHNGMRDIIAKINSQEFCRVRLGIGRDENCNIPLADYVLSNIPKSEREQFVQTIQSACDKIEELITSNTL